MNEPRNLLGARTERSCYPGPIISIISRGTRSCAPIEASTGNNLTIIYRGTVSHKADTQRIKATRANRSRRRLARVFHFSLLLLLLLRSPPRLFLSVHLPFFYPLRTTYNVSPHNVHEERTTKDWINIDGRFVSIHLRIQTIIGSITKRYLYTLDINTLDIDVYVSMSFAKDERII